jgi:hypothetical protein
MVVVHLESSSSRLAEDSSQPLDPLMGYLHNPTDIRENCAIQHLKVSHEAIFHR